MSILSFSSLFLSTPC